MKDARAAFTIISIPDHIKEMALSMCRSEQKNKSGTCERVQLWFEDVFMTGLESTLPFALDHPPVYLNLGGSYTLEDALRHSGNKSVFTIEKDQQLVAIETSSDIAPGADLILPRHAPPGLVILKVFNAGTCVPFGMQSLPLNLNNYSHISNDMKCFTLEGGILTESQEVKLIENVLALQKEGKGSGAPGFCAVRPGEQPVLGVWRVPGQGAARQPAGRRAPQHPLPQTPLSGIYVGYFYRSL